MEERKVSWKDACAETYQEISLSYVVQKKNAIFPESMCQDTWCAGQPSSERWEAK